VNSCTQAGAYYVFLDKVALFCAVQTQSQSVAVLIKDRVVREEVELRQNLLRLKKRIVS